jgi:hypothetical protein
MKHHDLEADMRLLVQELQPTDAPNPATLGRIRQRVAVSLIAAPVVSPAETAKSAAAAPAAGLHGATWFAASKGAVATLLAFGSALGAVGYSIARPPSVRVVYRDRFIEAPGSAAPPLSTPPAPLPMRMPNEPAHTVPTSSHGAAPTATKPVAASKLAAELQLIDAARAALATSSAVKALSALHAHAARYPHGILEQERDALMVKALVGAGRGAEARAASQRFIARYPSSTLLDSVRSAVATIP